MRGIQKEKFNKIFYKYYNELLHDIEQAELVNRLKQDPELNHLNNASIEQRIRLIECRGDIEGYYKTFYSVTRKSPKRIKMIKCK